MKLRLSCELNDMSAREHELFLVTVIIFQFAALCVIYVRRGFLRSLSLHWLGSHIFVFVTYLLGNIKTTAAVTAVVTEHLPPGWLVDRAEAGSERVL